MTIPDPPEMPANVRAGAAANSVTISWSAAARAAGYDVYLGGKVYDATGTETTITGLSSNASYTYQVRAKNPGGTSAYTVSQRITTMLAIPQIINLTVNMYSITAKWISVSGANRYEVLFNGTTSIIYGTSKTFLDLTPGTNYTFAIRALSASNSSEYSEMQTLRTTQLHPRHRQISKQLPHQNPLRLPGMQYRAQTAMRCCLTIRLIQLRHHLLQ